MEVIDAIRQRRSIVEYEKRSLPAEILGQVIEAAYLSPTAANLQSRQIVVVTDGEKLTMLSEAHPYCKWLAGAPAAVVLLGDPARSRYWVEDCSVAAAHTWLAAVELGLGAAWAAMYQSDNAEESERREQRCREVLGVPSDLRVVAVVAVGYPARVPAAKQKPEFDSVVHWGRYGNHQR